jgi:hypothetical protein
MAWKTTYEPVASLTLERAIWSGVRKASTWWEALILGLSTAVIKYDTGDKVSWGGQVVGKKSGKGVVKGSGRFIIQKV